MLPAIIVAASVYLVFLVVVAYAATHPARSPIFLSPNAIGVPQEDVEFETDGLKLRGWACPKEDPCAIAVLMHGYVMNRSENVVLAAKLHALGFACLIFDSRASGKSQGRVVGVGWTERRDCLAAIAWAKVRWPNLPIVLIGSSMGAAACAFAAAEDPSGIAAVVLDSSYASLGGATLGWWRFLGGPVSVVLFAPVILVAWPMIRFNPFRISVSRALSRVTLPTLILHGKRDTLASPSHAESNYRAAAGPKSLRWFENEAHSEARWTQPDNFLTEIIVFIRNETTIRFTEPKS